MILENKYLNIYRSFQVAEDGIFNVEITWKLKFDRSMNELSLKKSFTNLEVALRGIILSTLITKSDYSGRVE